MIFLCDLFEPLGTGVGGVIMSVVALLLALGVV